MPDQMRVLFITLSNVGDAILGLPALDLVRAAHPEARITVLAGPRSAAVFQGRRDVHQTLIHERGASWREVVALWRYLRAQRFETVIDLRQTLWAVALGVRRRSPLLRQPPRQLVHRRERHLWRAARALGVAMREPVRDSFALPSDEEAVARWWREAGVPDEAPLVAVSPGARSHIKRWTTEGFAAVADRLIAEERCHVVLTGEESERAVVEEVVGRMRERACHVAVGQTTVPQLAVLLSRCRLLIANDSATMHLGAYLGVPTVAIFGPTDPDKYGPRGPRHRVLQRQLHCVPCEASLCRFQHECMRELTAEDVCTAARELLGLGVQR